MLINIIVATDNVGGISKNGYIPWYCKADLKRFQEITTKTSDPNKCNAVLMGRKTYQAIGGMLPKRINYIVTRTLDNINKCEGTDCYNVDAIDAAIIHAAQNKKIEKLFIIGGEEIYRQVLSKEYLIDTIYYTLLDINANCDKFFPRHVLNGRFQLVNEDPTESSGIKCFFREYRLTNKGEEEYLYLLQKILVAGEERSDRTGVGTLSTFGEKMVFDISERLPLLTTKKMPWRTILRELLWFIKGSTNAKELQDKGIHIWDGNTSRQFLDQRGLTDLPEGDIGAGYGFQWRHFGADYINCHTDYSDKGVDQLAQVINLIKTDPTSRRIILTAWNPAMLHRMTLPPCHLLCQFYVRGEKYLDCQLYQRSGDIALGVPFNIASYSMLTYMIAQVCGLHPGKFVHILGDAHIYSNHIDGVVTQINRKPYPFPKFNILNKRDNLFDFVEEDFKIQDYQSHPAIQLEMAI